MKDAYFNALAHERRRGVLLALHETDGAIALDLSPTAAPDDGELAVEMHHRHMPMLQSSELVSWNADSGEVRCGARFDELQPVLDALVEHAPDQVDEPRHGGVVKCREGDRDSLS